MWRVGGGGGAKRRSVIYSTDEVSKICISAMRLSGTGTISIHTIELQISDACQKQNESI